MLVAAALLTLFIGLVHSYLGEKYILIRLFRRDNLPRLFGSDWFTKRTLRFVWHVTSLAWWGLGGVMLVLAGEPGPESVELALEVVALTFGATALVAGIASRGRHLSWVVFSAIAVLTWLAAR